MELYQKTILELWDQVSVYIQSFLKKYFIGFIEPNKITSGDCDIIISDGYTGNIILKNAEGLSSFITNNLKNVFNKSLKNKLSYKIIENDLKIFKDQINPDKYNGASLIGVNGISIKSHGNASPYAFSYALDKCYNLIKNNFNMKIRNNLTRLWLIMSNITRDNISEFINNSIY